MLGFNRKEYDSKHAMCMDISKNYNEKFCAAKTKEKIEMINAPLNHLRSISQ